MPRKSHNVNEIGQFNVHVVKGVSKLVPFVEYCRANDLALSPAGESAMELAWENFSDEVVERTRQKVAERGIKGNYIQTLQKQNLDKDALIAQKEAENIRLRQQLAASRRPMSKV